VLCIPVRPDPSLVASPASDSGVPSEGDIVSRMRAAIGLVDDLIERVEDYEIPKVVATVSTNQQQQQEHEQQQPLPPPPPGGGGTMPPAAPSKSKGKGSGGGGAAASRSNGGSSSSRGGGGGSPGSTAAAAAVIDGYHATGSDAQLLLRFYRRVEPGFATEDKVAQVSTLD
jgi:hypothetical protein